MGESLRMHACYEDYLDNHLVDEDLYYLKVRSAHCWYDIQELQSFSGAGENEC